MAMAEYFSTMGIASSQRFSHLMDLSASSNPCEDNDFTISSLEKERSDPYT
jgi:hypothetical protein